MKDRIPLNPGRVRLDPVQGETNTYDMTMADNPTEPGTALNKANLLTDATAAAIAAAFGSTPDTPNEAFALLAGAANIEVQSYVGTGVYGSWTNGNTLTFTHEPKVVWITSGNALGDWSAVLMWEKIKAAPSGSSFSVLFSSNNRNTYRLSNGNKTIEWYTTQSAGYNPTETQLNINGAAYLAISLY